MFARLAFALVAGTMVLISAGPAAAQEPVPADDPVPHLHARVVEFFDDLAGDAGEQEAWRRLLESGPLATKTSDIELLVARTRELEDRFGVYRGLERIDARRIGRDVVLMKYLYKCEHFPVVWYFTFYRQQRPDAAAKPENSRWMVIAVRFDADVELLGL